jgi:hypothetical protein
MVDLKPRFIFLGSRKRVFQGPLPPGISVCHGRSELEAVAATPAKLTIWISTTRAFTDLLLENAVNARPDLRGSRLITLTPPRTESVAALLGCFHPVFGLVGGFQWLPNDQMLTVVAREDAANRFIGVSVDPKAKALTLLRGDITTVIAPFSVFAPSGDGTKPDFTRPGLADYGLTITLGDYEASSDVVLYELDPDYRRSLKAQRRQGERTFGASLMRLRKQRRLKRTEFPPISSKEIARLERNEVAKPHARTLDVIATRLGVRAEELASF